MLFEETDNMVCSGPEKEITKWCKTNKVFDEITEKEIEEIWNREDPDDDENIRLNGKYVWEAAKRVCDFVNTHEDLITITSFGEYRNDEKGDEGYKRSTPRRKEKKENIAEENER